MLRVFTLAQKIQQNKSQSASDSTKQILDRRIYHKQRCCGYFSETMKESHKIQPFLQLNGKKFLHQFICYQCSINLQISIPNFLNIYIVYSSYRKRFQMKSVDFPQLLHVYFNYSHCVAMVDKLSTKVLLLSYRPQPEFKHIVLACHRLSLV